MATSNQTRLGKILTSRINAEIKAGTLAADTDIADILGEFVAGNLITLDEYQTLNDLILSNAPVAKDATENAAPAANATAGNATV
jgi:hypothetical protein